MWVWGALLRRDLLSAPHAIFEFTTKCAGQHVRWWASARRETWVMAGLVMAMVADLGAPLASELFATDAMGASEEDAGGYGIVSGSVDPSLALTVFEMGASPGLAVTTLDGDIRPLKHPERELKRTVPYTKLPAELFDGTTVTWLPVDYGRWWFEDHITLGEMRAVVRLSALLARCPGAHRHKVISLEDNKPCQGASAKGRSSAPALNFLLRKKAANCVASQLAFILPWTASQLMPADELSRKVTQFPWLARSSSTI